MATYNPRLVIKPSDTPVHDGTEYEVLGQINDEYELERDDGKVERWHMDKVSEEARKADEFTLQPR